MSPLLVADAAGGFTRICTDLLQNPSPLETLLLLLVIAVFTAALEDPVRLALVGFFALGLPWWTAFGGMVAGALLGDFGFYLLGRYGMMFILRHRWVTAYALRTARRKFRVHSTLMLFGARFFPGFRTPVYIVAGMVRHPVMRLLAVIVPAAAVQAALFTLLGVWLGAAVRPYLESPTARLVMLGATLAGVAFIVYFTHAFLARRGRAAGEGGGYAAR